MLGGLGNQMFQLAYAMSLAEESGKGVLIDLREYKTYKIRSYSAQNLVVSDLVEELHVSDLTLKEIVCWSVTRYCFRILQKIIKIITGKLRSGHIFWRHLSKLGLLYNLDPYYYSLESLDADKYFVYGYFQSVKYWKEKESNVRELFRVSAGATDKEIDMIRDIRSSTSIAISLRLGDDYRNLKSLNVCSHEYYIKALHHVFARVGEAKIYVFSDDIERAKSEIEWMRPVRFIEGFNDYQALRLMYSCDHFVISNSSFSWWGAYLGDHPNKVIAAPHQWFNHSGPPSDIFLSNMDLIEY